MLKIYLILDKIRKDDPEIFQHFLGYFAKNSEMIHLSRLISHLIIRIIPSTDLMEYLTQNNIMIIECLSNIISKNKMIILGHQINHIEHIRNALNNADSYLPAVWTSELAEQLIEQYMNFIHPPQTNVPRSMP